MPPKRSIRRPASIFQAAKAKSKAVAKARPNKQKHPETTQRAKKTERWLSPEAVQETTFPLNSLLEVELFYLSEVGKAYGKLAETHQDSEGQIARDPYCRHEFAEPPAMEVIPSQQHEHFLRLLHSNPTREALDPGQCRLFEEGSEGRGNRRGVGQELRGSSSSPPQELPPKRKPFTKQRTNSAFGKASQQRQKLQPPKNPFYLRNLQSQARNRKAPRK